MIKKWYCYICGKRVGNYYRLVSMNHLTDRVFLICDNQQCIKNVEYPYYSAKVKEYKYDN